MISFINDETDNFLATIRKYMQLRGAMTQKDLAELVNVGISTMSRFLNQKTKDLDPQLIASIVAGLNIPLHEVVDFVEEDSTTTFKKLVEFYKVNMQADEVTEPHENISMSEDDVLEEGLETTRTKTTASVNIGGQRRNIPFGEVESGSKLSIREKLNRLSPRQKGFLTDFLDLDAEGRDLVVDVGSSLLSYFRQSRTNFDVG